MQRAGKKREPGRDSLGWAAPIELYRPLLSYDELGGVLGGRPHELYDKMFVLLGLERITEARTRLSAALKHLQAPQLAVKGLTAEVKAAARGVRRIRGPRRPSACSRNAPPDVAAVQGLVTGVHNRGIGFAGRPAEPDAVDIAGFGAVAQNAEQLRQAVGAVAGHAGTVADLAAQHADLLSQALAMHRDHGDRPCPVCGVGRLDADWARPQYGRTRSGAGRAHRVAFRARPVGTDQARGW